jgi:hypothetical protein
MININGFIGDRTPKIQMSEAEIKNKSLIN